MLTQSAVAAAQNNLTGALVMRYRRLQLIDMPRLVVEFARHCVLDFIGVCIAGRVEPCVTLLADCLGESVGSSSVVGRPQPTTAPTASFVNATAAHALDYDDTHTGMRGHPTAPVLAAVLALAEGRRLSGQAALRALIVGIEAECLLGELLGAEHYERGWHSTATLGTFGAALGCCSLLELDEGRCAHAVGLAATQASGLRAAFGTMAKPIQVGAAARAGLEAAVLSAAGVTGPAQVLEGELGFASLHGAGAARTTEQSKDPDRWYLPQTRFKYHASCFLTHSAIEAARTIAQSVGGDHGRITRLDAHVSATAAQVCDRPAPGDALEAKFSLQATVAMALLGIDTADPAAFDDATLQRPGLADVMARVRVEPDQDASLTAVRLQAWCRDGSLLEGEWDVDRPEGDLATQRRRLQAKFTTLVGAALDAQQARRIVHVVESMTELETLEPIGAGLRAGIEPIRET